jgi:hypothetical protein
MILDTPIWLLTFWAAMIVGTISSVIAAIVLVLDYFAAAPPPEPRRSDIRHRLAQLPKERR